MLKLSSLVAFITVLLLGCVSPPELSVESLRDVADFPHWLIDKANDLYKDPQALRLQQHHFDSLTTGLDMKMNKVMPEEGRYNGAPLTRYWLTRKNMIRVIRS